MIKKRNLDNSLIQWIMTVTGLGPGIGDIRYIAAASSTTSRFSNWLADNHIADGDVHSTLALAEDAAKDYRNDVILAMPGAYVTTASLSWDKPHLHLIGLGGPNVNPDHSEANVAFYTTTQAQANIIDVTGQNCIFANVGFFNVGASATNYCAVEVDKYGVTFKRCTICGQMANTADDTEACASLYLEDASYVLMEDCIIGDDQWGTRTASNGGVIRFTATSRPNDGTFRRCRIQSRSDTQACAMVALPVLTSAGRNWLWDNCVFTNYDDIAFGHHLNQVFYTVANHQKHTQLLHNCSKFNIWEWDSNDREVVEIGAGTV